ncbi:hypothetical protein KAR91_42005 [Candidatus Pacearchaeota archaeon]|nr:hypothetical protein [Candidatus Pacearchaeota archaeon]
MAKGRYIQNSFNAGEWSPLMAGRIDLDKYPNAVEQLENLVIDPRGPAVFRPGMKYIAGTKTNASVSVVIPFEFAATVAYMLEFGDSYIRFYKDQAQIESGGNPYEIASPYAAADLSGLKYCQSADVIYLFHPDYAIRKLSRAADDDWSLNTIDFRPAPTAEDPLVPETTLTLQATSGDGITFTAGAGVFKSGDVGRLIISGAGRASIVDFVSTSVVLCNIIGTFSSVGPIASGAWSMPGSTSGELTPSIDGPVGSITNLTSTGTSDAIVKLLEAGQDHWIASGSGTNEYYLLNAAPGYPASKPSKVFENDVSLTEAAVGSLAASQWDWADNDTLGYDTIYIRLGDGVDPDTKAASDESFVKMSSGSSTTQLFISTDVGSYIKMNDGFIKITTFVSATSIKGEILKVLSDTTATSIWTLESETWTDTNGYPSVGVFFEDRLFVAGSPAFPETVWASVVSDYENFTPGIEDADSMQFSLSSRQVSVIRWMEPKDSLFIGCAGGEWRIGPEDTGEPLTPLNIIAKQRRTNGCANALPVTVDSSILFIQRENRKLREFLFRFEDNDYIAPDLTLLSEHITRGGVGQVAYQQNPLSIVWCVRDDGKLLGMTYLREQNVVGWHLHETDGEVESIAVIPGDGYDELWMIVKRGNARYVEMLEAFFEDTNAEYKANKGLNAFFVDSGITYNSTPTITITGLGHLEGESVAVLADASVVDGLTVASGQITLPTAASVVHVGLPYTGTLKQMRFNTGLEDGTAQGRKKRIPKFILRVNESGPFKAGRNADDLLVMSSESVETTTGGLIGITLGAIKDLFSGDIEAVNNGAWDREGQLTVVQDKPLPLTLLAIIPEVAT